ncbi:MAG: hypothetical protein ACJA0M_001001, partial [Chitinophagales bacterium]
RPPLRKKQLLRRKSNFFLIKSPAFGWAFLCLLFVATNLATA